MKVIGLVPEKYSGNNYICEVSHSELKKFLNVYAAGSSKELKSLEVGHEIDLGTGYDFYVDTNAALKKTQEFIGANAKVLDAIFNGIKIMGKPEHEAGEDDDR